jgi:hypothetical protein
MNTEFPTLPIGLVITRNREGFKDLLKVSTNISCRQCCGSESLSEAEGIRTCWPDLNPNWNSTKKTTSDWDTNSDLDTVFIFKKFLCKIAKHIIVFKSATKTYRYVTVLFLLKIFASSYRFYKTTTKLILLDSLLQEAGDGWIRNPHQL